MQIYYNVSYSGENITDGYQRADMPMATINFRDNSSDINSDSDVNVIVTAMNVFGSGSPSDPEMSQIGKPNVLYVCMFVRMHVLYSWKCIYLPTYIYTLYIFVK